MDDLGLVAIILLFGVGFALFMGGTAIGMDFGTGFGAFVDTISAFDVQGIIDLIIQSVTNPINAAALTVAFGASFLTGQSIRFTLAILILVAVVQLLFIPFTFMNEATSIMPVEIRLLISGFFSLLLIFIVLSFVSDRRL